MKVITRLGVLAFSALVAGSVTALPTPALADTFCVSGAEVSAQVHTLVASLKDDVRSSRARSATAHALVETVSTMRGEKAQSPTERAALGEQVSTLAKQLHSATSKVEGKALVAQIVALKSQRGRGALTDAQRADIRAAVAALKVAVVSKTDTPAEDRAVAAAFKALHAQWTCLSA